MEAATTPDTHLAPPVAPRGAFRGLRRVHFLAQAHADRIARAHGLTMQQWELLVRLRRAGGALDQRELCGGLGVAPATMSALVDSACERGLVVREAHPGDRRRRRVALSAEGRHRIEEVPHLGREIAALMTVGFSEPERAEFARLLELAARNLSAGGCA
jgi:MarR family transcriptional regulator, transcriptional regulator for hemolysin